MLVRFETDVVEPPVSFFTDEEPNAEGLNKVFVTLGLVIEFDTKLIADHVRLNKL
jgi:hypothetical protein